jgi:hypothetical protein
VRTWQSECTNQRIVQLDGFDPDTRVDRTQYARADVSSRWSAVLPAGPHCRSARQAFAALSQASFHHFTEFAGRPWPLRPQNPSKYYSEKR